MKTLHLMPGARESGLEALGELGLADAGKAGHVHRDARLQADRDQLDEVFEFHLGQAPGGTDAGYARTVRHPQRQDGSSGTFLLSLVSHSGRYNPSPLGSRSGMGETPRLQAKPSGGLRYDGRPCANYRRAAHTVYSLHYHFVFITKYRKPVLRGEIGTEVRDLIREICRSEDIEILQGHVRPDHVHLLLSVPPHLAPSRVMQAIKGKTSHHLLQDHRRLRADVLGSAPVGARLLRVQQRERDGRDDCRVYSAARCRAPGRRPLPSQRVASLHGAARRDSSVDFSRPMNPSPSGYTLFHLKCSISLSVHLMSTFQGIQQSTRSS